MSVLAFFVFLDCSCLIFPCVILLQKVRVLIEELPYKADSKNDWQTFKIHCFEVIKKRDVKVGYKTTMYYTPEKDNS